MAAKDYVSPVIRTEIFVFLNRIFDRTNLVRFSICTVLKTYLFYIFPYRCNPQTIFKHCCDFRIEKPFRFCFPNLGLQNRFENLFFETKSCRKLYLQCAFGKTINSTKNEIMRFYIFIYFYIVLMCLLFFRGEPWSSLPIFSILIIKFY